jgi:hypothetical protein
LSQPPADGVAYAPDITVWLHPASKAIVASSAIVLSAILFMPSLIDDWIRDARLGWGDHRPYAGDIEAWDVRSPRPRRPTRFEGLPVRSSFGGQTWSSGTPVVEDYLDKMPFAFTGTLRKFVVVLEPQKLSPDEQKVLREAEARALMRAH